jgi:hypothetical protein
MVSNLQLGYIKYIHTVVKTVSVTHSYNVFIFPAETELLFKGML